MPKHAFKFPRAVVEAVRSHVEDAIRRVPPERFRQEATYTAALANQLQGVAYNGEHGSVVFESTIVNDRGANSAESRYGADMAITATVTDGRAFVRKAILIQAKLGRIEELTPAQREKLEEQIHDMKQLVDAPKVMEIPAENDERHPAMISGNRILEGDNYVSTPLADYFVTRVTTTLDGTTDQSVVDVVQDSSLPRAHMVARLQRKFD